MIVMEPKVSEWHLLLSSGLKNNCYPSAIKSLIGEEKGCFYWPPYC